MISSHSSWDGAFAKKKGSFEDKFKVVDKRYDEVLDTYEVDVLFYAKRDQIYTFYVTKEEFEGTKKDIGQAMLRELQSDS